MNKNIHEIRDPIHVFVRMDNHEREILNSRPFQRLRHIHQLAMTYMLYPGATHKRFEHSIGVMELAGRVFDVITRSDNISDEIRELLPQLDPDELRYWRKVLRIAALCHDIGHLPFSHAAEEDLLPGEGEWNHEKLTREIIQSEEMMSIWEEITPPIRSKDVVKLAIGPQKAKDLDFSYWETILSEIIVGDAFGVDRVDYLLRDSHHAGVAYGKFDHYRLIDTLRILSIPNASDNNSAGEPALGVEEGGIQSAEALMIARYFMYSQVYFHPVRRIYDLHLQDFLKEWLPEGLFSTDVSKHLQITDNEISAALWKTAFDENAKEHIHAYRIVQRKHFKRLYQRNPEDVNVNPEAGKSVFKALGKEFGEDHFRHDRYTQKGGAPDFPVRLRNDQVVSSLAISDPLQDLPVVSIDYVFANREILKTAQKWLKENHEEAISPKAEEDDNE
ncbi:MAG: HD domain-containing protein [Thermodesulfobacteriota bacterium]